MGTGDCKENVTLRRADWTPVRRLIPVQKMVPLSKRSKKEQKRYHDKQRGSWYGLCPVTRTVPNKKAYDRNRVKRSHTAE